MSDVSILRVPICMVCLFVDRVMQMGGIVYSILCVKSFYYSAHSIVLGVCVVMWASIVIRGVPS